MITLCKMLVITIVTIPTVISDCNTKPELVEYEITGKSAQDLRKSMTNNGPQGFDAYTTWNVQYSWDSNQVSVSGQITMPKVKSQCSGAVSAFKKYYRRLYQHELQHIEHGRWLCREMERVFQSAGSKSEADSQFMKLLAEANDKDKGYDSKTGHGDTEGVCFNSNCSNALFSATNSAFEKCLKSGNAQNKRKKRK